jgi:glycosyltransferase involved in cell wall biosynthesis
VNIAVLHYHLRPGGVTTVIRNELRALSTRHRVQVLAEFGYDETPSRNRAAFIAESRALAKRLTRRLGAAEVLHTHNIGLGKHPRLTYAVKLLAERGAVRLINQVHDFPEDNRPAQLRALRYCTGRRDDEFWKSYCYYHLPNVRWATLTTHDAEALAGRGIPENRIHVLPNSVDEEFFGRPRSAEAETLEKIARYAAAHRYRFDTRQPILLSPMKVMVRKNNAEAIELVNRLGRYQLVISLDASAPADRAYSDRLKRRILRERLPVVIGVGEVFDDPLPLFDAAQAILTTSTAEGFGYVFIEGWLRGKLVVGRDIPAVTNDFRGEGMDLRHLYRKCDAAAVRRMGMLLSRPPRGMIAHNRAVVLKKYSWRAYSRRFAAMMRQFAA